MTNTETKLSYKFQIHVDTLKDINEYHEKLKKNPDGAGAKLKAILNTLQLENGSNIENLTTQEFIQAILQTKSPKHFAESDSAEDWSIDEQKILANINTDIVVRAYNTGKYYCAVGYDALKESYKDDEKYEICGNTFNGILLTRGSFDYNDVVEEGTEDNLKKKQGLSKLIGLYDTKLDEDGKKYQIPICAEDEKQIYASINKEKYQNLLEKRLLVALITANANNNGIVTIPSAGCGVFAGIFQQIISPIFEDCVQNILAKHQAKFPNIKLVQREGNDIPKGDLYRKGQQITATEAKNEDYMEKKFGTLIYRKVYGYVGSMMKPEQYGQTEEEKQKFKSLTLRRLIAGDAFSWLSNGVYRKAWDGSDEEAFGAGTDATCRILNSIASLCPLYIRELVKTVTEQACIRQVAPGKHLFSLPLNMSFESIIKVCDLKLLANCHNIQIVDPQNEKKLSTLLEYEKDPKSQKISEIKDKFNELIANLNDEDHKSYKKAHDEFCTEKANLLQKVEEYQNLVSFNSRCTLWAWSFFVTQNKEYQEYSKNWNLLYGGQLENEFNTRKQDLYKHNAKVVEECRKICNKEVEAAKVEAAKVEAAKVEEAKVEQKITYKATLTKFRDFIKHTQHIASNKSIQHLPL